ncbi:branched-chain amino acid ABC transporter, permease protein [Marvinbryantia formatexigens DSM 14469]|uniref:Branched-chain amino acid ABC transporter, permease protein n=1 Tax=Marvinbryantia formatexigens DSM 14469 TaxID=478749 RepID=C6LCW7_9FIRM|nr:ABC transporter integral membrane protein [Marvinbryantia formatexigens]EET61450.1 branched-chain amino acid ABC transporter, permease protein [Marvinbryantia formatexigens DSM 14469]UWO26113.1 hypothetical protein NQ534_06505 [Marvinbryantia formatexigens DSM 14469]SDF91385.1 Ribose/xylose/arabinose/galactoside ABC-type transport system, permease component [Marvinbryantia formatexigens]
MSKLKIKKPQMIACVLLVIAAIICGAVGMYGMSSRSSEKGNEILSNMRLQAILDTAGTGAVDAYVAAAKTEATAKVREEGGGMSEIRDASTKAEEEARALAEQEGIGSVDLSEIDTAPLAESLNVLADAQKAYFAEEADAQARYIEEHADEVVSQETEVATEAAADDMSADAAGDDMGDMEMAEETVDLSGFEATAEMLALQEEVDAAYDGLCVEIKKVFPALTDDILTTLKPTITSTVAQQGDTFETQYDRALSLSGMNPGMTGSIMRQGKTLATTAVGLLILAVAVLFYTPLVKKLGFPRLIIGMFYILLCLMAYVYNLSLPGQISNTLVRLGMNGVLVLAMLPGIQCGISLNLGLPIGIIGGIIGGLLCIEFGFSGWFGFLFAVVVGLAISAVTGCLYGMLLNRLKGSEMSVTTYVGFSIVSLMCIAWLVLPFKSKIMKWPLGNGLRTTIGLQTSYRHLLNDFLSFKIFGVTVPTGLLLFFALCCFLVWLFMRSKTGIAMSAAGANPRFAEATGINVDKMRIIGTMLSTMLGAVGIIVYAQSFGFIQLYQAPRQMGFLAASAILLGGATTSRAKISHVIIGTFLFQGVLTLGMPVANAIIPQSTISEVCRIIISQGIILYALTKSGGDSRG